MGLLNFFRIKPAKSIPAKQPATAMPVNRNLYLLDIFKQRLCEMGWRVEWHKAYLAIIINDELEIATLIIDNPNNNPGVLQLLVLANHPKYFPTGIQDSLAGIGATFQDQVDAALNNYINATFSAIMESFSESHSPAYDFMVTTGDKPVLWHPKFGNLVLFGEWNEQPQNEPLFECIKHVVPDKLTSNKINWLKIYLFKHADKPVMGECVFNNQPWDEGLTELLDYADSWSIDGDFKAIKQFIMFRRCDKHD